MRYPLLTLLAVWTAGPALAADEPLAERLTNPQAADVEIQAHVLEPKALKPSPEQLDALKVPEGFEVSVFAENLANPRMLAVAENGDVYVTRRRLGDVLLLRDENGDGKAETRQVVANRPGMHGIAIDGSTVYLVTIKELYRATIQDDGTLSELELLLDDLPDAGQHPNRTLVVGPDKSIYLSVGSTCNACSEDNPESATMLKIAPDGSSRSIYASGLRNTIGFAFHPKTGELYGMDHGIDWLGDNVQYEELNHLVKGNRYGWPYIYGDGQFNPQDEPPGSITLQDWADQSVEPEGLYTPHAAPMQMVFYTGDAFPDSYHGDAFVAMRGSWNRKPPSGYEVMRVVFEDGKPTDFKPFVTGFLQNPSEGDASWAQTARLAGIAQTRDGALLFTDDTNGVIYRVAYQGDKKGDKNAEPEGGPEALTNADNVDVRVSGSASAQPPEETPAKLVTEIVGAPGDALDVSSPIFSSGDSIPDKYAAEGENISPALSWTQGPEGTQSYAILMEDPDVTKQPPFVHWLVYNIPANTRSLPEGVPPAPILAQPEGTLQGANERGSLGYYGPRPPKGDPAHEYHFQVLALDSKLDLPFGASRAEILQAIDGKVLASGSLIGTFER